jgi:hypothetical protein
MVDNIVQQAIETISQNQECFIAQWILNNPDENVEDWVMCYQPDYSSALGGVRFWMERK